MIKQLIVSICIISSGKLLKWDEDLGFSLL